MLRRRETGESAGRQQNSKAADKWLGGWYLGTEMYTVEFGMRQR
jgi:hypothetical protein